MHIVNNIKNFLYDQKFFVSFWNNNVHIFNYLKLVSFNDFEIKLKMEEFDLRVLGAHLKITKMEEKELIINGTIKNIEVLK